VARTDDGTSKTAVSVVIATWNSARTLKECLESIARQTTPPFEVIVVDNHSTDGTEQLAEESGAEVLRVRGSRSYARNFGVRSSSGTHILFVDSDQLLQRDVVEECVRSSTTADVVVVPELFTGWTYWGRCSANWKNHVVKVEGLGGGIPRFYERRLLADQKPFREEIAIWEDYDLYQRIRRRGIRAVWCRSLIQHIEPSSLGEMARKEFRYGVSIRNVVAGGVENLRPPLVPLTAKTIWAVIVGPSRWALTAGTLLLVSLKAMARVAGYFFASMSLRQKLSGG